MYTIEIVRHLLAIDQDNEYVLIYPGLGNARTKLGPYERHYANVAEVETAKSIYLGTYWERFITRDRTACETLKLFYDVVGSRR